MFLYIFQLARSISKTLKNQRSTLEVATYPNSVARTGVLHGEAAKANVSPARYACTPYISNCSKVETV